MPVVTIQGGNGVVRYEFDPSDIPNATVKLVRGERTPDGGCSLAFVGTGNVNQVIIAQEIEYDPASCVSKLATAVYPRTELPAAVRAKNPELNGSSESAVEPSAVRPLYTRLVASVLDPVWISVNSVTAGQVWTNRSIQRHVQRTMMLTASGWSRTYYSPSRSGRTTRVTATFRNTKFCFVNPTTVVKYHWVSFTTRSNGTYVYSHSVDKSGGCHWMLSRKLLIYSSNV